MILGYSANQIRQAEAPHLEAGEPLMERAAAGLAAEIRTVLAGRGSEPGTILVLAGSGDNGGDALFASAALASTGVNVRVVTTGDRVHEQGLAAAEAAGAFVAERDAEPESEAFAELLEGVDVVVDGILGIGSGADPALRGRARRVVEAVRPRVLMRMMGASSVVAVDLPSGIGSDDGSVPDPVVLPALVTVTFGAAKAGLLLQPAAGLVGRLVVVDIGIADDLEGVEPLARLDG
ncbi:hypothetical protein GCM10025867_41100 [Frondihabitans sucicola]|uniref:NAD(P)H-hydrate epimerase n=1 Tax=Frondihabitans sucicola TaxID=1268041 RepID=A0ABM8GU26_9MICO|nr:NAD(P)H-hydrate epimerase [Frondihabitans sucicola]BDZ51869.1 hypothetical protein GCM10025867_41100 [Frondihabitans sucicola]